MRFEIDTEALGQFCRERGIARLELFGSALRDDFREHSDVDLLVTLRSDAQEDLPKLIDQIETYLGAEPPPGS